MTALATKVAAVLFAFLAVWLDPACRPGVLVHASNFNKPHSHTGKVTPFTPGDPNVKLDGKAKGILKAGKPYQVRDKGGMEAVVCNYLDEITT